MSDSVPFDSLSVGTAAVTEEPAPQAPPIPDPIPIPPSGASRSRRQAHPDLDPDPDRAAGAPDPDPDPGPPSGAPSHLLSYELGKPLQSPHSRFRQIFNNGQDFRYAHVTYDETGHPGRCAKDTENHIAG